MKTRDLIEAALRKIGVVAHDEPMTAEQAEIGLLALNMMLHAWELDGVDISHADLALTDDFPMEQKFHEGVVYCLASRISPDFTVAGFDPSEWFRKVQAAFVTVAAPEISPILRPLRPFYRRM